MFRLLMGAGTALKDFKIFVLCMNSAEGFCSICCMMTIVSILIISSFIIGISFWSTYRNSIWSGSSIGNPNIISLVDKNSHFVWTPQRSKLKQNFLTRKLFQGASKFFIFIFSKKYSVFVHLILYIFLLSAGLQATVDVLYYMSGN